LLKTFRAEGLSETLTDSANRGQNGLSPIHHNVVSTREAYLQSDQPEPRYRRQYCNVPFENAARITSTRRSHLDVHRFHQTIPNRGY
jgi:hypothetical protein